MYLSKFTDYSFRILIYLGNHPNELFIVDELSSILELSLKKSIFRNIRSLIYLKHSV
jgi:Rrf2 family nitric oxide-sensitive transcriptional repressor